MINSLPTQAYLLECLDYDPTLGGFSWRIRPRRHFRDDNHWKMTNTRFARKSAGALHPTNGYRIITIDGGHYKAARVAWVMITGSDPGIMQVDHINTLRSDDRWHNLRLVSNSQNAMNRKAATHNQSGFKGVCRARNRWKAQITVNYINHRLGVFDTPEEAYTAYVEAAHRLHGRFANTGDRDDG